MINRVIQKEVEKSLTFSPIVGILGPRQVGKTTLAKEICREYPNALYIDLELPSDRNKLQNAEYYLENHRENLIIIDEIQILPELFPLIRSLVDKDRRPARFMILGSSSPDLKQKASNSLAGRIIYHYLPPLLLNETWSGSGSFERLRLRGGFPNSYLAGSDDASYQWRESFIAAFLERDIPNLGVRISSSRLRTFWTMLAHSHGSVWNASKLAAAMGVSPPTISAYLDILEETFLARRLPPYFTNVKKRLIKAPKVYLRDSGLLHTLLNIRSLDDLLGHPISGHSWEGFVVEQLLAILPAGIGKYFYRTSTGNEIDLILTKGNCAEVGVEIKFSLSPAAQKGFWYAYDELKLKQGYIVYPGTASYAVQENLEVISIYDLERITAHFK